jgi:hypothetical protein
MIVSTHNVRRAGRMNNNSSLVWDRWSGGIYGGNDWNSGWREPGYWALQNDGAPRRGAIRFVEDCGHSVD